MENIYSSSGSPTVGKLNLAKAVNGISSITANLLEHEPMVHVV